MFHSTNLTLISNVDHDKDVGSHEISVLIDAFSPSICKLRMEVRKNSKNRKSVQ